MGNEIPSSAWTDEVREAVELLNLENGSETDVKVYAFGKCKEYNFLLSLVLTVVMIIIMAVGAGALIAITADTIKDVLSIIGIAALAGIIASLTITVLKAVVTGTYVITDSYFVMYRGRHSKDNRWLRFTAESAALKVGNRKALYVAAMKNGSAPARRKPKGNYIGEVSVISITGISEEEENRVVSVIEEMAKRQEV